MATGKNRYLLYSHWGVGNKPDDICKWERENRSPTWLSRQPVCKYLKDAKEPLIRLLEETDGLLVLFFDPGWKLALKPSPNSTEQQDLEQSEAYASAVWHLLFGGFATPRLRILTVRALQDFIKGLRERDRRQIYRWFVGEKGQSTYDSPKVIEAFLRVRLLGSGVPILRIDWDALVNVEYRRFKQLGVTPQAIEACLKHDEEERTDVSTRTWVCSAGYQPPSDDTYDSWSRGFATRIQPALLATPDMCKLVYGGNFDLLKKSFSPGAGLDPKRIAEEAFNLRLTQKYLGLKRTGKTGSFTVMTSSDNIAKLGAHPLKAVISGALLNLSASAILDLPPFSNMTRGVMWIDDHLKFELHRALKHLRPNAPETCRIATSVVKGREHPAANLAAYTWAQYLPTLLLGLVMDSWIRRNPDEVDDEDSPPLVKGLEQAITTGDLDHRSGMRLEMRLREVAIQRISRVHDTWKVLKKGDQHTLVSAWATSAVKRLLRAQYPHGQQPEIEFNESSRGLGLLADGSKKIEAISDLSPPIQQALRELIWDAVDYIHLTVHWPGMIQTIRAVVRRLVEPN